MTKHPFMQFYPGDYLADTQHLTTEQHGAYLLILMAMWTNGGFLPNDDKKLSRIARVTARRWHLVKDEIIELLTVDGDQITQLRLKREHQKAVSKSEKRSACGKLGGRPKLLINNDPPKAKASDLLKHLPEPDTITRKKEDICRKSKIPYTSEFENFWKAYPTDPKFGCPAAPLPLPIQPVWTTAAALLAACRA